MRQVLAELEVTSNAPTSSYNPSGGHGAFASREPTTGDSWAPHLRYRRLYEDAVDERGRECVIEDAAKELHRIKHSSPPARPTESDEDRDARVVRDGEGWEAEIAATHFRLRLVDVWRVRRDAGRDKDYGRPVAGLTVARFERRARVQELKARNPGMTARQIALHVGADHKTVLADLRVVA